MAFVDAHRDTYGVEPICAVVEMAPSAYYAAKAAAADPECRSCRTRRDAELRPEIQRVWHANRQVYWAKKVWNQLRREAVEVARCTVARLMKAEGLRGVVRGRRVRTTRPAPVTVRPLDLVQRQFRAERPNQLWVADFTYVALYNGSVLHCLRQVNSSPGAVVAPVRDPRTTSSHG